MTTPIIQLKQHVHQELGKVVFGLDQAIQGLVTALISGGHVLIHGVPGLGKTMLAKNFATLLAGRFKRIQCTADMMPSDITGIHIYLAEKQSFDLVPGPIFADVLLVDEINRTGPKTQSALLQAMEEGMVTIDRRTYRLPKNFLVIASQNPIDFEGTYPLPESQIDRFLLRLDLDYPEAAAEEAVLKCYDKPKVVAAAANEDEKLQPLPYNLLEQARQQAADVHISEAIYQYAVAIATASRQHGQVSLGLSTRGALHLMRCARVEAALDGVDFVRPDDLKRVAPAVMAHRLQLTPDAALEGIDAATVVASILEQVEVPR